MSILKSAAQNGCGVTRPAERAGEFLSSVAARSRALCAHGSKWIEVSLVFLVFSSTLAAQSFLAEINQEHDPAKRSELALSYADESFDNARSFYKSGTPEKGDAALDNMTTALQACVQSLAVSNKARFYKKAEMKVAYLQRRLSGLIEDLSVSERGWAEQTKRKVEDIHEKLLDGVMRK